jgi:hypothetical protein
MKIKSFLYVFTILVLFSGCGRELTDAELLQKDRDELKDMLTSNKVLSYKFVKLMVRTAAADVDDPKVKEFKAKTDPLFIRLIKFSQEGKDYIPTVSDLIGLYKDYLTFKEFAINTDEDIFPTLTEGLSILYQKEGDAPQKKLTPAEKLERQNVEHAGLSALVMLSRDLGRSIALYECAETEPAKLPDGEVKSLLAFYRGFVFLQAGLYYLSEEALTENIDWLAAQPVVDMDFAKDGFNWFTFDNRKVNTGFHGMNHLMRGIDRLMMDRDIDHERAMTDLEQFLADSKAVGLDNEIVWVVEAYVLMKKEKSEEAIVPLKRLRKSPFLSEKEYAVIDETIPYLEKREPGKALNGVYDNVFIGKILIQYILAQLSEIDWKKMMHDQGIPYSDEIYATIERINRVIVGIDQYTSTDAIEEVGKEVGTKAEEEGKNLWDKAKSWWEEE